MIIKRTANAGILLILDGVKILLDGVCKDLPPYIGTPDYIMKSLMDYPDILAFTHIHLDHFDPIYASLYKAETKRHIIGIDAYSETVKGVNVSAIPTRHIGKTDVVHHSFIISGKQNVWFMGDSSPLQWKNINKPAPDVVVVPYAFALSDCAWKITKSFGAKKIVLLHLPDKDNDENGLCSAVYSIKDDALVIPEIGESIEI